MELKSNIGLVIVKLKRRSTSSKALDGWLCGTYKLWLVKIMASESYWLSAHHTVYVSGI